MVVGGSQQETLDPGFVPVDYLQPPSKHVVYLNYWHVYITILLQLASVYFLNIQAQYGDYFNPNRFKNDTNIQTINDSNNLSNINISQYITIIIDLCEDANKHVSTIIDLKLSSSIQQGNNDPNINLINSLYKIQLNHIKISAINIQAKCIVQLIHLYLYIMDYVNCEQEILKLAQLQVK
ncbi:unnamed protein product [Schistosoma margrebowiei]|uniref:Uncharacterized protein n=1 Tax=Schistosoma margrebowiei TaxID=48269 RepID=A0A183MWU7_9TREM|nr:unnamed protein product [Schistosoma margrebowiei]